MDTEKVYCTKCGLFVSYKNENRLYYCENCKRHFVLDIFKRRIKKGMR